MAHLTRAILILGAAAALAAQPKKLVIERMGLHQFEDGPLLDASYELAPGETAYFTCRVTGYQVEKHEDIQRVKLAWQMQALDPRGVLIEKPKSGRIEDRILPQDKNWTPKVTASFTVPPFAPGGLYRIAVTVTDESNQAAVPAELVFHVTGRNVAPSDTLITRNFQFLHNENDTAGMREPVYHPGERLWARFDITGYKFAENNRFLVKYGLAVLNAQGTQLFSQPEAASETDQSFYPQRYVPGLLSLSLNAGVARGSYTLAITIQDEIGNQTWEDRQAFRVE